jgi:hypothetical protein
MKFRAGFVSNSSSSSFIIARAQVGDAKFEAFAQFLDDQGVYYDKKKNYIFADTTDQGFDDEEFEKLGIKSEDYMSHYE